MNDRLPGKFGSAVDPRAGLTAGDLAQSFARQADGLGVNPSQSISLDQKLKL